MADIEDATKIAPPTSLQPPSRLPKGIAVVLLVGCCLAALLCMGLFVVSGFGKVRIGRSGNHFLEAKHSCIRYAYNDRSLYRGRAETYWARKGFSEFQQRWHPSLSTGRGYVALILPLWIPAVSLALSAVWLVCYPLQERRGGKVLGLGAGVLALFLSLTLIVDGAVTSARQRECARHIRVVGDACLRYAEIHGGEYPSDLSTLLRAVKVGTRATVACPAYANYPWAADPYRIAAGLRIGCEPHRVVVYENQANHFDWCHVYCFDGSIRLVDRGDWDRVWEKGLAPSKD